ncbi:hypothetical protein ACFX1R_002761 [Malus domestica]
MASPAAPRVGPYSCQGIGVDDVDVFLGKRLKALINCFACMDGKLDLASPKEFVSLATTIREKRRRMR